jgi:hypothetical protein
MKNHDFRSSEPINDVCEGECVGCDLWLPINDLGLCDDCNSKLERDLIRQRDWEHSATAFAVPVEKLEELRRQIIAVNGDKLELIAPEQKKGGKKASQPKRSERGNKG